MNRHKDIKANSKVKVKKLTSLKLVVFMLLVVFAVYTANAQQLATPQDVLGRLFFNEEERNVMEAVRQGIVDPNVLRPEEQIFITPQLEVPEIVFNPKIKKVNNRLQRESEISFQGIIRKHGGDTSLLVDGTFLSAEDLENFRDSGLKFRFDEDAGGSAIIVEDNLFKSNIALNRGDTIGTDGVVISPQELEGRFIIVKKGS